MTQTDPQDELPEPNERPTHRILGQEVPAKNVTGSNTDRPRVKPPQQKD
ncbi:hypothetical protein [Shimazuella kribbensis]|nr:hypothetical protein [Shimazuella kribbensis]